MLNHYITTSMYTTSIVHLVYARPPRRSQSCFSTTLHAKNSLPVSFLKQIFDYFSNTKWFIILPYKIYADAWIVIFQNQLTHSKLVKTYYIKKYCRIENFVLFWSRLQMKIFYTNLRVLLSHLNPIRSEKSIFSGTWLIIIHVCDNFQVISIKY